MLVDTGGPTYVFTGLNAIKPQMLAEATVNARAAAEQFAADIDGTLGGIRRASQGIFEILPIDEAVKHLIIEGKDAPEIKREAVKNGMRTLRQSALRKLAEGQTTFEEVVRVTGL